MCFRTFASQKESEIEEGHLMPDHVHMLISIPPKYSTAQVAGYNSSVELLQATARSEREVS